MGTVEWRPVFLSVPCLGHAPSVLELEDFHLLRLAAIGDEDHLECAISLHHQVFCSVLVSKGVTTDDDGLLPSWHQSGDSRDDNGLAEDGTSQGISDGAIRRQPHCGTVSK